ncbi:MAG: hypothetical protein L6R42_004264 [Xanthoria sp. 1 TBL-2021]|nr:MAG: hypothetical protein L6R42_004264 [Xanthoria sp. 1 TBL-2021]
MTTKDRTHDLSFIDNHIKDPKALGEILNRALVGAFPKAGRSRYCDVHVLLLSWEDDDLRVASEINDLDDLFRDIYRYSTNQWRIPSTKSHNALARRIIRSLDEAEASDKLLIVYYGGHGFMNEDRQCVWLCNQEPDAATAQWSSIQTMLEEADCDVLILLDCCAAASSADGHSKGTTEIIAACGFEAFAPGVGEHSFTRSLIEELRWYAQRPGPISISFLHNKVLARAKKSWNPRYATDGNYERRRTPIYIHLADRSNQRCIELTPLLHTSQHLGPGPSQESSTTQFSTPLTSASVDVDMSDYHESSQSSLDEVFPDPNFVSPKVLITIALQEEQTFHTRDWITWLEAFPAVAKSIHIESVYQSDSTFLLLLLPVAMWDLLPRDPAISFVAFVRSRNLKQPDGAITNAVVQEFIKPGTIRKSSTLAFSSALSPRRPRAFRPIISSYGQATLLDREAVADIGIDLISYVFRYVSLSFSTTRSMDPDKLIQAYNNIPVEAFNPRGHMLGILGFDNIGTTIARKAYERLGMKIGYHDARRRSPEQEAIVNAIFYTELVDMVRETDCLLIALPHFLIDTVMMERGLVALLPSGSRIVRMRSANMIDQGVLADALSSGHLAAAGLDRSQSEPRVSDRLAAMPNVTITNQSRGHLRTPTEIIEERVKRLAKSSPDAGPRREDFDVATKRIQHGRTLPTPSIVDTESSHAASSISSRRSSFSYSKADSAYSYSSGSTHPSVSSGAGGTSKSSLRKVLTLNHGPFYQDTDTRYKSQDPFYSL